VFINDPISVLAIKMPILKGDVNQIYMWNKNQPTVLCGNYFDR